MWAHPCCRTYYRHIYNNKFEISFVVIAILSFFEIQIIDNFTQIRPLISTHHNWNFTTNCWWRYFSAILTMQIYDWGIINLFNGVIYFSFNAVLAFYNNQFHPVKHLQSTEPTQRRKQNTSEGKRSSVTVRKEKEKSKNNSGQQFLDFLSFSWVFVMGRFQLTKTKSSSSETLTDSHLFWVVKKKETNLTVITGFLI